VRVWFLRLLFLLATLGLASWASADAKSDRAQAIELGHLGVELYNSRRFVEAYERFERADKLVHSPVFVLYMARCRRNLGELLRARALYRSVVAESVPKDAKVQWRKAVEEGRLELPELEKLIPSVRIILTGVSPKGPPLRVWLDRVRVSQAKLAAPISLNPGTHHVVAQRGTEPAVHRWVRLEQKQSGVAVRFEFVPANQPAGPVRARKHPAPPPDKGNSSRRRAGAVFMALGGVAGLIALGTGIGAVAVDSDLEELCPTGTCAAAHESTVSLYYGLAHTTTVTLVTSGVFLGLGLTLYFTGKPSTAPKADQALVPLIGPGTLGLRGSF